MKITKLEKYIFNTIFTLLIALCGCNNHSEINEETIALNDVFKGLTDSIIFYREYPIPPPPSPAGLPPDVADEACLRHYDSIYSEYAQLLSLIDTNKHVISINDTLTDFSTQMSDIVKYFRTDEKLPEFNGAFDSYLNKRKSPHFFDVKRITNSGKFELLHYSTISNEIKIERQPTLRFYYYGRITFSRIYFNNEASNGIFECEVNCGQDCMAGYFVFINKNCGIWTIKKIMTIRNA